jgi:hypothetical protein
MKTPKIMVIVLAIIFLNYGCTSAQRSIEEPVDHVNPYMGNISHLLVPTFPTIHLPNSLLRVYPERNDFTGLLLKGLPLMVTSHRGSSAFNLSPFQGDENDIKPAVSFSYWKRLHPIRILFTSMNKKPKLNSRSLTSLLFMRSDTGRIRHHI